MHRINIKPLSTNSLYKGRRYRTNEHDKYKRALAFELPDLKVSAPPLRITLEFGTCKMQDLSNNVKGFEDALVDKYGFDDRDVYEMILKKVAVKKGFEYISFKIESL